MLLVRGAKVNATEPNQHQTALMWAAAQSHPRVLQALIEAHADLAAHTRLGFTALHFAARVGDMATCVGPPDVIAMGSPTVFIGGQMAARLGDPTAHGGVIVMGCPTVNIGIPGQGSALQVAAETGAPFCET